MRTLEMGKGPVGTWKVPIDLLDTLTADGEFLLKRCIVTGSKSFSVTQRKF